MLDFEILGNDIQTLEIRLKPGEIVKSEPGAMIYMQPGIKMEGKIFEKKNDIMRNIINIAKRMFSGENFRMVYYENTSKKIQKIGFSPDFPSQIIPLQLEDDEEFYVQPGAYLASTADIDIDFKVITNLPMGFLGGDGFILQKLIGPGIIFINGYGNVQEIQLNQETILVDNDSLVGYTSGITEEIELVKGLKNIFLSGEGLTNVKLSGTGSVFIQNISYTKFLNKLKEELDINNN